MAACSTIVSHYDIYGHLHTRVPFKDMVHTCGTEHLNRWTTEPRMQTRSQLSRMQLQSKVPHMSYDIDGDGVVGQKDLFLAKHFDVDKKDYLTEQERNMCAQTMAQGFGDQFSWNHDRVGSQRPFKVSQRRGKILSIDNVDDMALTYPPHHNAAKLPLHRTCTELSVDRLLDRRKACKRMKETWDQKNPVDIEEPYPAQEWKMENPVMTHIVERGQADHEEQRVKSGLHPVASFVNPEREHMAAGRVSQTCPEFRTRGELLNRRKELLICDLEEQRKHNECINIPLTVQKSEREANRSLFQREDGTRENRYTATLMKHQRVRERHEYDLTHFGCQPHQHPRYSDQSHPWWDLKHAVSASAAHKQMSRSTIAPALVPENEDKFQDGVVHPRTAPEANCDRNSSFTIEAKPRKTEMVLGEMTAIRWSEDMLVNGRCGNQKRYFDGLKPIPTEKDDCEPLTTWSSFELVKKRALRVKGKALRQNAAAKARGFGMESLLAPKKQMERSGTSFANSDKAKSHVSAQPEPRSRDVRSTLDAVTEPKGSPICVGTKEPSKKIQTTVQDVSHDPDLSMMHRTLSRLSCAGVRSSGFQRLEKR